MKIEFVFDGDQTAEDVAAALGEKAAKTPSVIANALNIVIRKVRKRLQEENEAKYTGKKQLYSHTMPAHDGNPGLHRASRSRLEATINIAGTVNDLLDFKVSPKNPPAEGKMPPRRGTRAQVLLAGGTMKLLEAGGAKAFVTQFKSGHVAVVQRNGKKYTYDEHQARKSGKIYQYTDRKHDAIKELYSISVPTMTEQQFKVTVTISDEIQTMLNVELQKQIEKTLGV